MAVALILAAGRGERLGSDRPKALVPLAGRPLLRWSVDVLEQVPAIQRIVLALPADVQAPAGTIGVQGGAVRSQSVRLALAAAGDGPDSELVLVHDAARPLLNVELVEATLAAAVGEGIDAAIAAAPVTDTIKRAAPAPKTDSAGARRGEEAHMRAHTDVESPLPVVAETLDRSCLWAVQTPQVFRRAALERALDVSDELLVQATDDAWLVERAGGVVVLVPAPAENLKVTTPLDLELAEMLLAKRRY